MSQDGGRGRVTSVIELNVPAVPTDHDGDDKATLHADLSSPDERTRAESNPLFEDSNPNVAEEEDVFVCKEGGDVGFRYKDVPNLPPKYVERLQKYDTDGNGEISLSELLEITKSNRQLARTVFLMAVGLLVLICAMFAVSWVAADMAKDVETRGSVFVVKGDDGILAMAQAQQTVPLTYTTFFDQEELSRIKQVQINKMLRWPGTNHSYLATVEYVMQVTGVMKYNDTLLDLFGIDGQVVNINRGVIYFKNPKIYPTETVLLCAEVSCSSVSEAGLDIPALEQMAVKYNYPQDLQMRRDSNTEDTASTSGSTPSICHSKVTQPWGVAFSGGGWRSQAASIGFAKALWESNQLPLVDTMGSVSGGSWFSMQYAYSEEFFNNVNSKSPTDTYLEWLNNYYQMFNKQTTTAAHHSIIASVAETLGELSPTLMDYLDGAAGANMNWEVFINQMLESQPWGDNTTSTFTSQNASMDNRKGNDYTDLLICTNLAQEGQMMSNQGHTKIKINAAGAPDTFNVVPMAWHVPGTGRGTAAKWLTPQYDISSMTVEDDPAFPWQSSQTGTRRLLGTGLDTDTGNDSDGQLVLSEPSVGKAAAMSSAAAGILGAPALLENATAQVRGILNPATTAQTIRAIGLQDMAVCAGDEPEIHKCQWPNVRLLDGGFSDDGGIALMIGKMQKEKGVGVPLRIAALDTGQCNSDADSLKPCYGSSSYNLWSLFGQGYGKNWKEGYVHAGPYIMPNSPSVNATIFDKKVPEEQLTHTYNAIPNSNNPSVLNSKNMSYSVLNVTTVEQKAWGIKAGTPVEIFSLHVNSGLSTELVASKDDSAVKNDQYADLGQRVYDVLTRSGTNVLQKFFQDGGSAVTSCSFAEAGDQNGC